MTDDGRRKTDERRRTTVFGLLSSVVFGHRSPVISHSSAVFGHQSSVVIARGLDDQEIDFVLIGDEIDKTFLVTLIEKVEKLIKRKVKCFILRCDEEKEYLTGFPEALLLWEEK